MTVYAPSSASPAGGGLGLLLTPNTINQWYSSMYASAQTNVSFTINMMQIDPPFFSGPNGISIDKLDCNVGTAGSGDAVVRGGVYTPINQSNPFSWATGQPYATLLLDAGTIATATTGQKIWNLAPL